MELPYELNVTPRASIDSQTSTSKTITPSTTTATTNNTNTNVPQHTGPTPSIRLLFSILPRRYIPLLLLPAILSSLVAGGIAPFMTYVVGQVFNTFAQFPLSSPTQTDKDNLLAGVGIAALQLIALAVGSMALGSLTSALWIWLGEINVKAVREYVYEEVAGKDVAWFDLITANDASSSEEAIGAAGLMAKFSRETDEVRQASSLALGTILQSLTTVLACLVLAFTSSYQLTLVILSAVPLLTFLQALSQILATPLLAAERHSTAVAATRVERAISAIATVKAFNAEQFEETRANGVFLVLRKQADKLNAVWAFSSGSAQFVMMAMFVQGFWFGAKLVREGKVQPGVVMAVFWACLIATSSLQMCIPHLITLAKGKSAMAALMMIAQSPSPPPASTSNSNNTDNYPPQSPITPAHPRALRKIVPQKCTGELSLTSVSFTYPSRPSQPALSSVSLFLPAGETTYIVGASGSGKSTVAALLAGMYRADEGVVGLDEQDVRFLDEEWVRGQVMCVVQGGVVVIDGRSVSDNILAGVDDDLLHRLSAREKETKVRAAAQAALLSEWVLGLENGYDTILAGSGTASSEENSSVDTERSVHGIRLSGGQLQRLALARAFARQPTVLVLDEATSALDPAGRLLVGAALRRQRQGASSFAPAPTSAYPVPLHHSLSPASPVSTSGQQKRSLTTVIITHDLTGIEADDFVYVMSQGRVVEGGYRCDLEREGGEFGRMWGMQGGSSGSAVVDEDESEDEDEESETESQVEESEVEEENKELPTHRPLTFGNWMFEVVADLTGATGRSSVWGGRPAPSTTAAAATAPITTTTSTTTNATTTEKPKRKTRPASISIVVPSSPLTHNRRYSLPYTPTSAATTIVNPAPWGSSTNTKKSVYGGKDEEWDVEEAEFGVQKSAVQRSGARAREGRVGGSGRERRVWVREAQAQVVSEKKGRRTKRSRRAQRQTETSTETFDAPPAFWGTLLSILPTIPHKTVLVFSLLVCLASGALTPVFSFLLSRLLFEVSIGARDPALINKYGGLVLGVAAADGVLLGMKYFLMEWVAGAWTTSLRSKAFSTTLSRPKAHFDSSSQNSSSHLSPARLTQSIVRDADDARNLVSVVLAQGAVVSAMVGVGLVWALVRGWQLTLAGFAIAPIFAGVMALQAGLVGKCEGRNKRAREEVARGYYETIINIRGIRCTSLHRIFRSQFLVSTALAKRTGVKGALVEGCTHGVASALIYLAEALLFYIGAVLIAQGAYTYLQMVETLNLVVFSVTIGAQLMAFTERIAKATQATADLQRLLSVQETEEEKNPEQGGWLKSQVGGEIIKFENIAFTYPSAPTVPVLRDVSLTINPGECIALVGASGSGKSTLAALLQKLYTPTSGTISIGAIPLPEIETKHLREHLAVVSQHPALFDASIAENIRYGSPASIITDRDVCSAAKKARVHDFVMGLEGGYETNVGENAGLISGGQGQRLAIARALARPSADVLVLDECTSALDAENQAGVLDTIAGLRTGEERGRMTTVMVTHKVGVMQMCDRVVVLKDGEVVESGTYHALMERKGVFATLARAGEWVG